MLKIQKLFCWLKFRLYLDTQNVTIIWILISVGLSHVEERALTVQISILGNITPAFFGGGSKYKRKYLCLLGCEYGIKWLQ